MKRNFLFAAAVALSAFSTPALAGDAKIMIHDAYARASSPAAKAGAAFMEVKNMGSEVDRLISVTSDASQRVQLHTHRENGDGVMSMVHVEDGFEIQPGETLLLARGGNHVMFMGLNAPFEQGKTLTVTLSFEKAGDIIVEIPVDLERKPAKAHGEGHGEGHSEGHGSHSHSETHSHSN